MSERLALEGNIRILVVQTLISTLGFGMFVVIWQPYLVSEGVSIVEISWIQSVINLSSGVGLIAWGVLSDRYGRKPVIIVSNVCRILAIVALIMSRNLVFLLVYAFLLGFSALFMIGNPARSALITESVISVKRATAFSTLMAFGMMANTITASVGGYLAVTSGYTPILYLAVAGDIIGLILITIFLRETLDPKSVREETGESLLTRIKGFLVPEKGLRRLYLILFIFGVGYGTGYSLFFATLVDNYGFSAFQLGLMSSAFSLTWAVASIPCGKLSDRIGRKPMFLMSLSAAIITVVGFLTFRSFEAFLFFEIFSGLDPAFWIPTWMAYLSERVPSEKLSTVMGKIDAYSKIAGIPAPWLGGFLYTAYGFSAPLLFHLVLLVAGFLLVATLKD
ncbi:MFS transporter [Candidatus Bathyarchaeota archaeon]|nr:MFS transporter [Candidatus Bathyarchaeota archaeon]